MSKKIGFPVMSTMITAIIFVLGLILTTLNILIYALTLTNPGLTTVYYAIWFIALFLFGWGLFSFALNPELEDYQRNVAFFFVVLLVAALLTYGVSITVTVG